MKPSELLEGINIPDSMNNWEEVRKLGEKLDKRFIDKEELKKILKRKYDEYWADYIKKEDVQSQGIALGYNDVLNWLDTLGGEDEMSDM